ncbi:hypothetical protein [Streptomyces sp. SAS_270]|uniref:hypothetical protein n=1 Tax=Streptomyces sp. SAS_270 TaxID=3412748 RepID=UPI00403D32D1
MADWADTTDELTSDLIDLSGVSLGSLGEVDGLSEARAALHGRLAHVSAPLCESGMAALCGIGPWAGSAHGRDS